MADRRQAILDALRKAAEELGAPLVRRSFLAHSGITEYQILKHFPSWKAALAAAGLEADSTNVKLEDSALLEDWGAMVRENREIPTRNFYRRHGNFGVNSFANHFGPWSSIPEYFRMYAQGKPEWADVLPLLPEPRPAHQAINSGALPANEEGQVSPANVVVPSHEPIAGRQTYGGPIDFRGLRHEPTNENGVVFLFGMVAKELGYYVEAVQAGFPDCEAKRQIGKNKWQKVRIEFEYESRNFRDHGHPVDGCDLIVCWRHNWADCPAHLEVLELRLVIDQLAKSDD